MLNIEHNLRLELPPEAVAALVGLIRGASAQPATGTAILIDAPLPGQHWADQVGTYAGIMRGDEGLLYHLIIGPDSMDFEDQPWGSEGQNEPGASSCWDGKANSQALIESPHDHPAAQAIHQLNADTKFGDWYLPAQAELSLCRATVRHLFKTDDWYWSSTQCSAHLAWYQHFTSGGQDIGFKSLTGRVRAVRRLIIQ